MTEQKNRTGVTAPGAQQTVSGCTNGIDRGVPSLVAEDNPDDFQIGADRKQTRDDEQ
jgi:hypothetical protein